jgi:hypothetical protein
MEHDLETSALRKETVFSAARQPVVQVLFQRDQSQVYVLVMKPGYSKEGYMAKIPTTEEFIFR